VLAWKRLARSHNLARQAQPGAQVPGWWQVVRERDWRLLAWKRPEKSRKLEQPELRDWRVLVWWREEQPGPRVLEVVPQEQQRERLSLSCWRVPVSV